jgi:hypothetical protein
VTEAMGLMSFVLTGGNVSMDPRLDPARDVLLHLAKTLDPTIEEWPDAGTIILNWNDAADQTAENVALGLEYAALVAEQEEGCRKPHAEKKLAGNQKSF